MKRSQASFSAVILALSFLTLQFQSCKAKNEDASIQSAINSKTASDANLANVSAVVADGTVTLLGNCADEDCRKNAERAVKDIDGVKKVVNNIMIAEARVTPDNQLQSAVADVVKKYDDVEATVSGGVITLRGKTNREKLQQLMMDLNMLRPRRIENQLVLE